MGGVLQNTVAIVVSVEHIMGNLGHGLIAVVNFMRWAERRKMSLADQILTALAISRVGFLWLIFLNWWISQFYPDLLMNKTILEIICIFWVVTSHFSIWLGTDLSIFYFLKIANFSNSTFLYLKWRVTKVVSATFLGSLILLFLNIILMEICDDEWLSEYKLHRSYNSSSINSTKNSRILFITETVFALIPLTISSITFVLLIVSLWKHLKKMGYNLRGPRDISIKAHIKALLTMIVSLLLYITFYLVFILYVSNSDYMRKNLIVSFLLISMLIVCPLSHSFILILGNNNLRQDSISMLMCQKCWFKNVEALHP